MDTNSISQAELLERVDTLITQFLTPGFIQNAAIEHAENGSKIKELTVEVSAFGTRIALSRDNNERNRLAGEVAERIAKINHLVYDSAAKKLSEIGDLLIQLPPDSYLKQDTEGDAAEVAEHTLNELKKTNPGAYDGSEIRAAKPVGALKTLIEYAVDVAGGPQQFQKMQIVSLQKIPEDFRGTQAGMVMSIIGSVASALNARMYCEDTIESTMTAVIHSCELVRDFSTAPTLASRLPVSRSIQTIADETPKTLTRKIGEVMKEDQEPQRTAEIVEFPLSRTVH